MSVPEGLPCALKIITDLSATATSTFTGTFYFLNPPEGCICPLDIDLYFQYTLTQDDNTFLIPLKVENILICKHPICPVCSWPGKIFFACI